MTSLEWTSSRFTTTAYGNRSGYATMDAGIVGDFVASLHLTMDDGMDAEVAYLRLDPARMTVDLLLKLDLDTPWSLESSRPIPSDLEDQVAELASAFELDSLAMFELMIAVNNDLQISGA